MPSCQAYKYLLVVTDMFSTWVEDFPTRNDAKTVVKGLVKEIISRFGKPMGINSGPAFNARRPQSPAALMELQWWLHGPYHHHQSSGQVDEGEADNDDDDKWPDPQLCCT